MSATTKIARSAEVLREAYLEHFRACASGLVAELAEGEHVELESEMRDAGGSIVLEGPFQTAYRQDAVVISESGAKACTFECADLVHFEAVTVQRPEAVVELGPFHWDNCGIELAPARSLDELAAVRAWFLRWFRADAEVVDGVVGAIHFMTDPQSSATSTHFIVDLGTSPTESLEELVVACESSGAQRIRIFNPEAT